MNFKVPHEPQSYCKMAIPLILELYIVCVGDSLAGGLLLHNFLNTLKAAVLPEARQGQKQLEATDLLERPGSPVTPVKPELAHPLRSAQTNLGNRSCCVLQAGWLEMPCCTALWIL